MLGISIYPEHQDIDVLKTYITNASKLGYKRIFSSLIEVNDSNVDLMLAKFKDIINFARELGFEFVLDVNPQIFEFLNISFDNLSFFKDLNCSGIRLDDIISAKTIADLTHNEFDLKIEVNCSNSGSVINEILEYEPIRRNLIACHNFYPQRYSGLDFDYFMKVTKFYKDNNIRTAAFVSANEEFATHGPWPINEGICTLEKHRNLPIHAQAKLLFATNLIDDVIIGNACASLEELEKLATTNYDIIELDVNFENNVSDVEVEIACNFKHFRRGDITPIMIRSTMPRVVYEKESIAPINNNKVLNKGDIIICNDLLTRYKGELHLILSELEEDKRKNLVAKVANYDLELLDYITPWKRFKLVKA